MASLCVALLASACRQGPALPTIAPGETVLAFGDSVTYGTGANPGEDWPSLLATETGWRVVNEGVPGDTAQAGRTRLEALLRQHAPALVLIEIGGNDFLRRRPPEAVKEDLRAMIRRARESGAQVALIAVPELSMLGMLAGRPADAAIYEALADEERVALVPKVFSEVLGDPGLRADRIHPNARGYHAMARGIHARLKDLGLAGGR